MGPGTTRPGPIRHDAAESASRSRPVLFGIVNITEDSFSDGGRFLAPQAAIDHALKLVDEGADVIDLGPAASNPSAKPVTAQEEIQRLEPVMDALIARGVPVSVDSFQPETQAYAIRNGAAYLNDVTGFPQTEFYGELGKTDCRLVVMHSLEAAGPATRKKADIETLWAHIEQFFAERIAALESAGIARERLILDPGMGLFVGRNAEASLFVLRNLAQLRTRFGLPVLVSVSRKSFLRTLTGRDVADIGPATRAAELWAATQGAAVIRTHEPGALRDALTVWSALGEPDD